MTAAEGIAVGEAVESPPRTTAPITRVLLAELRLMLRRPRNLLALLFLACLPVLIGIGVVVSGNNISPMLAPVTGNGLVLPVISLLMAQTLLLPLVVAMVAADAFAGESTHGTLRGLLIAPIGRIRLVAVKTFAVVAMSVLAVAVIALSGVVTGLIIVGGNGMVTLSGSTVPLGAGLARVLLAAGWSVVVTAAIGMIALAISSLTDHPLVVMAGTMGILIVFGVLGNIPALDWLQPVLITTGLSAVMDVLRDPIATGALGTVLFRACCYLLIGLSVSLARMGTKDV